jgi:hypothetical protein
VGERRWERASGIIKEPAWGSRSSMGSSPRPAGTSRWRTRPGRARPSRCFSLALRRVRRVSTARKARRPPRGG